jgi:hypothetical protein
VAADLEELASGAKADLQKALAELSALRGEIKPNACRWRGN